MNDSVNIVTNDTMYYQNSDSIVGKCSHSIPPSDSIRNLAICIVGMACAMVPTNGQAININHPKTTSVIITEGESNISDTINVGNKQFTVLTGKEINFTCSFFDAPNRMTIVEDNNSDWNTEEALDVKAVKTPISFVVVTFLLAFGFIFFFSTLFSGFVSGSFFINPIYNLFFCIGFLGLCSTSIAGIVEWRSFTNEGKKKKKEGLWRKK